MTAGELITKLLSYPADTEVLCWDEVEITAEEIHLIGWHDGREAVVLG